MDVATLASGPMLIESPQNDTYKKLVSLTASKGLKDEGLFLLSGEKLIREFLALPSVEIIYEIVTGDTPFLARGGQQLQLAKPLFDQLDVLGTHFNLLALKQPAVEHIPDMREHLPRGIEVVVPVGDPGNLGALIRSAEAFGVPRIVLTREAAHPFLPKCVKASAGSVLRVKLARGPSLSEMPEACIALDMEGVDINSFVWPKNGLLLVGEEGPGYSAKKFQTRLRIPIKNVESLNVVVAASIAMSRVGSV